MKLNFNKNRTLQTGLPQMANTLNGWEVPLTLEKIQQKIIEGDKIETTEKINFLGVFQPLKQDQLQSKPENFRSWSWYWIHCKSGTLNLQTGDKIIFQNERYKVMGLKNYDLYGYIEYEVIRDYEEIN